MSTYDNVVSDMHERGRRIKALEKQVAEMTARADKAEAREAALRDIAVLPVPGDVFYGTQIKGKVLETLFDANGLKSVTCTVVAKNYAFNEQHYGTKTAEAWRSFLRGLEAVEYNTKHILRNHATAEVYEKRVRKEALREAKQIIAEILAWIDAEQPNFVSSDGWLQTEKKATGLMLEAESDDSRTI